MYTINAITPLLNPEISDQEAREVVAGLTDEQKDIAILALSLSLYNDWTEEPTENDGRKYVFRNDTGTGSTTVYSVFPGIELLCKRAGRQRKLPLVS